MNLFVLDNNMQRNAQAHYDKHVIKQILEASQIMATVIRGHSDNANRLADAYDVCKATYPHHPCTIWAGETRDNFLWTYMYAYWLQHEWQRRYGHNKQHKALTPIRKLVKAHAWVMPERGLLTPHPIVAGDHILNNDPVDSYREYYMTDKRYMASWKNREQPTWWH